MGGAWFSLSSAAPSTDVISELHRRRFQKVRDCQKRISSRLRAAATEKAQSQLIRVLSAVAQAQNINLDVEFLQADVDAKGAVPWEVARTIVCGMGISEDEASQLLEEALPGR